MAKIIDLDIVLPIIVEPVRPNLVEVGTPVVTYTSYNAIEVETTFSSDVDYVGGISIDETDATYLDNPQYISKRFTGLTPNTKYTFSGVGLAVMGQKTYGPLIEAWTSASPIPDEYQLVEYLEATGTQYIEIPYFLASGNTIEMELVNKNTGNDNCFIGGNQGGNRFYAIYDYPAGQFDLGYVGNNSIQGFTRQERMVVTAVMEVGNQQLFKNGNQIYQGYNQTIINLPHSLKIFCLTQGGSLSKGECYRVVVSKNNQIDLNLYPVYRKADSKPGMFDIINNTFYTNAGTGEFTVGPDKEWEE